MKAALRQRAWELGFEDCRVTTAAPPASAPAFRQWLAAGQHGAMGWLERNADKRVDPQQVLPGARSIITLAVSYAEVQSPKSKVQSQEPGARSQEPGGRSPQSTVHSPQPSDRSDESDQSDQSDLSDLSNSSESTHHGTVARYACYRDYHDVLAERLKQLAAFLDQLGGPGTRSLWYTDTGPLLERDLAQRAGLGFVGKHTNLISRRFGNWILLAEMVTTLELPPDEPERNRCGSCTRCLAACPTGAIKAPFQLDARLCISYLTIELKGSIPVELRPAIGRRIFGCDDCLAVCPWNRFAHAGRLMREHARPDLATPDLVELLGLDEAAFKRRFAGTPILRAKRRGLLRNVCIALGNSQDPAALPALEKAARDPEPLIAEHARWAIEQLRGGAVPEALNSPGGGGANRQL